MDIGKKVKEIINFKKVILDKIYNTFSNALTEIGEEGVDVRNKTTYGQNLEALIDRDHIVIPLSVVLNKLRNPAKNDIDSNVSDEAIKNIINELIVKELNF